MQAGYYTPSALYPIQQLPPQGQYPIPQAAGSMPYVSHYVGAAPPLDPRQDSYANYLRHRYETYVPPPPEPAPRSKHQRSNTIATTKARTGPLKSAMKKRPHERSESMGASMSRQSSRAPSEPRERTNSMGRPPAQPYIPDHIFVMFPSSNEIRMESIAFPSTVDEIRQNLLPMWPHRGNNDMPREGTFRAMFNGTPWASSGTDYIIARRMIQTLWAVLAHQGYTYLSTTSTAESPAKLVFVRKQHDQLPYFFSVSISQSGSKFSFLDAPARVVENLSDAVRGMWPHRISADRRTEDGLFVFELRKNTSGEVDKNQLAAYILGYFNSIGFKLDGSIPMGKAGPLGFGSRKELWILRSTQQQSSSANGHNSVHAPNSPHGHGEY